MLLSGGFNGEQHLMQPLMVYKVLRILMAEYNLSFIISITVSAIDSSSEDEKLTVNCKHHTWSETTDETSSINKLDQLNEINCKEKTNKLIKVDVQNVF